MVFINKLLTSIFSDYYIFTNFINSMFKTWIDDNFPFKNVQKPV